MKKHLIVIQLILFVFPITVLGQQLDPLDLAKKIFSKEVLTNLSEFTTGEYKGEPNGQHLADDAILNFKLLGQTESTAVVNMTILDSLGKGVDTYLHFEKDSIWKMKVFRALAMTEFIEQMVDEMENMSTKKINEMIRKVEEAGDSIDSPFKNREEFDVFLNNSRLTIDLDDNIIEHFITHKPAFNELKDIALDELLGAEISDYRTTTLLEGQKDNYKRLLISGVSFGDYLIGSKCLSFWIGGMVDNTVGYLYVRDKRDLPKMHPSRLIMLREIGNGWYMYKTT